MPPECCCSSSSYGASALPEPVQLVHPVPACWSLEQGHHCRRKEKIEFHAKVTSYSPTVMFLCWLPPMAAQAVFLNTQQASRVFVFYGKLISD